jgi:hypothetical protein
VREGPGWSDQVAEQGSYEAQTVPLPPQAVQPMRPLPPHEAQRDRPEPPQALQ